MARDRPRFRQVVVATDFSPGAAAALGRVASLPLGPGATVSILHVVPSSLPARLRDAACARATRRLRRAAAGVARAVAGRVADLEVGCTVAVGAPHVEIIRHARAIGAELVLVGRHGPRAVRDALLGSTAERVVRKGDVPVLLVNEGGAAYRRVLVAVDLSDASGRVVDLALALLPPGTGALRMVHAFHVAFEGWLVGDALAGYRREHREAALAGARRLAASCTRRGIRCDLAVREGDPRSVVLREAVRADCDLVVIGTHARSGVAHALLGSVAEWLIRAAPCDVAVTRPARFTFDPP